MSRRTTPLLPDHLDGTSRRDRTRPALDPNFVQVDGRGHADLLAFVQRFAERLRFYDSDGDQTAEVGTWGAFAAHPELTVEEIAAYIDDPEQLRGSAARWISRPHFALLLTFLKLIGHARDQLNDLPRRHLEYFYREILRMQPAPARPDRVTVAFTLASRVGEALVPVGTELSAGPDSQGVQRIYRTERPLLVNRARVESLRTVYVDREITRVSDVRQDQDLTAAEALDAAVRIALGSPSPGDPVRVSGADVNTAFLTQLRPLIDFSRTHLYLEHHELRDLMRRQKRRHDADDQWSEINRLLGVSNPSNPRDFAANLAAVVGDLDFKIDGLPQVNDITDLFAFRADPKVRQYIDSHLDNIGFANFTALMEIKGRIDAEWQEINRALEHAGRRHRRALVWRLRPSEPNAFHQNLVKALHGAWPPPWPAGVASVASYERRIRALEAGLHMPIESLQRLVTFAELAEGEADACKHDWQEIDRILVNAHAEKRYAERRVVLHTVRGSEDGFQGLTKLVTHVLRAGDLSTLLPWEESRKELIPLLETGQLQVLDGFCEQLSQASNPQRFDWADVYRVLELAQRKKEKVATPDGVRTTWRNLYALADAPLQRDASSSHWHTVGGLPKMEADQTPPLTLGFALRTTALGLSEGERTITVTLGFSPDAFDLDSFLRGMDLKPEAVDSAALRTAIEETLVVQVSTEAGWIEPALREAKLATKESHQDYWSIRGDETSTGEVRPALQLTLFVDASQDALEPISGDAVPELRLMLRPRWHAEANRWITRMAAFQSLNLVAAHLRVDVVGLTNLRIQQEDRRVDPAKPWEPFGRRPVVGARLFLSHPELIRCRLQHLRFNLAWMGLPPSLEDHYHNYDGLNGASSFQVRVLLVDRSRELELTTTALFEDEDEDDDVPAQTQTTCVVGIGDVSGHIAENYPGFAYARCPKPSSGTDLRTEPRHFRWDLYPVDFGHVAYPRLAASKARQLAIDLGTDATQDAETYRVEAPYTPTLQGIRVDYATSIELIPQVSDRPDQLLHIHPFGEAQIRPEKSCLMPQYEHAGELYIGLADVVAPQQVSLGMQLAEGTSDPDLDPSQVIWSVLDGEGWRDIIVAHDATRGLLNSGVVELEIPVTSPSRRLPVGLTWLRVAVRNHVRSVCDTVSIRPQAVTAVFEDRGNAAEHYASPLPAESIVRFVRPNPKIIAIEQPVTSFGGVSSELPALFYTRVSERLRHKQRALTPWDYECLALQQFGQLYKVKCLPTTGEGLVDLIVIPDLREVTPREPFSPKAPANLLSDVATYLQERAPHSACVRVRNARYVPVTVRLGVRFIPGQDLAFSQKRLNEDLQRFLSPWAFDEGVELMIGGKVYATSIIDFVERRDYVDYVVHIKLFRGLPPVLVPPAENYCVQTSSPDEVLVAAQQHHVDVIAELGYHESSLSGINFMKIELDFFVGS